MHTGIISFADRIVHNIKTNETKDLILGQLYSLYGIKIIQKHYHKLDENNVKYLKSNPYLCTLRSNGNPYYMFFTKYNDIPIIYFIDKKIHPGYQKPRILLVRGLFHQSLYENTLIDGEMVKCQDGKWIFLMNDMIACEGKHLMKIMLPDRLKMLYDMLQTKYTVDNVIDVCQYKVKTYYHAFQDSIQALIELSKKLAYTCRGIYIWSYDLRYKPKLYNFNEENIVSVIRKVKDETEFQIKKPNADDSDVKSVASVASAGSVESTGYIICSERNVIQNDKKELWITQTDYADVYNLYDNENILVSKKIGTALIPDLQTSKMIRFAFKNRNAACQLKVMCLFNDKFTKWFPIEVL
jgi:hypothetical protein